MWCKESRTLLAIDRPRSARTGFGRVLLATATAAAVVAALLGAAPGLAAADAGADGAFSDDDGSVHEPALDALAARGVLAGIECGEGLICPSEPLKRSEMAVWLVRVLDGADPDPGGVARFVDVDAEQWWAPFVERLYALEVTVGCTAEPARFCPDRNVTRAQMATFLKRAFDLEPASSAGFTDVDADGSHGANIDALAAAGITVGCSRDPLRYCPANSVTRAQMATFLARALGLIELAAAVWFTAIDVGGEHTCGLRADSTISCWGDNWHGQSDAPAGEFQAVSAGERHSCGLRADFAISCWGDNDQGQSDAPAGEFRAVSAGGPHSCGLHTDGTVVCWGHNEFGQSDAPRDSFRSVSAGFVHTCGVRSDFTVLCWGNREEGQSDPPEGNFSDVRAGGYHTCGLRTDSTAICWGINFDHQADAPGGRFDAVSPGWVHTCGLRVDGTAACWGYRGSEATNAPTGTFTSISASTGHSCGLRVDGTIVCWGATIHDRTTPKGAVKAVSAGRGHNCAVRTPNEAVCWGSNSSRQAEAPGGEFDAVAAGAAHSCGLSVEKTIVCWGGHALGQVDAPGGEFNGLVAGDWHSCGLRTDEAVVCWGENGSGEADAPEGAFSHVGLGTWHSCAVRADRTAICWGNNSNGQAEAPGGEFVSVIGGSWHSCGLRTDETIVCWGASGAGQLRAPAGEFVTVASGHLHTCAIRDVDGTVVCWGSNEFGQLDAPDGEFVAIDVGQRHSCAIRVDGTVECWGLVSYLAPPSDVVLVRWMDQADPSSCRRRGIRTGATAGFPLPLWAVPSMGTARVAVLFVDFPDAPASHSTTDEAELGLSFVERYLETVSYGRFDIEFEPLHRWLRAEQGYSHYLSERGMLEHRLAAEAIRLADPEINFADYDLMMFVMPSSHWSGGNALLEIFTGEGSVSPVGINVFPREQPAQPTSWGSVAAHEIAHGLGLTDLYPYDDSHSSRADAPTNKAWVDVEMGLMSMRAHFIASSQDPRLAHDWRHPDGYRLTAYRLSLHALEMLSWSRWQLGWLDASQVTCLTEDEATITLSPVADPDGGTAMAAVPLSDHETLVIESRRKIGYDAGLDQREPDGATTTFPVLATEGVLVYTVDASLHTGELPLKVAGDTGDGLVDDYPVLTVGHSVTVRGYTITVVADDGDTHTVTITKTDDG